MGTLNIRLDEEEIQELMKKYLLPSGLIDYASFCDNINQVFQENPDTVIANSQSTSKFTEEEKVMLTQTVQDMKNLIKAHRILLKPSF